MNLRRSVVAVLRDAGLPVVLTSHGTEAEFCPLSSWLSVDDSRPAQRGGAFPVDPGTISRRSTSVHHRHRGAGAAISLTLVTFSLQARWHRPEPQRSAGHFVRFDDLIEAVRFRLIHRLGDVAELVTTTRLTWDDRPA